MPAGVIAKFIEPRQVFNPYTEQSATLRNHAAQIAWGIADVINKTGITGPKQKSCDGRKHLK